MDIARPRRLLVAGQSHAMGWRKNRRAWTSFIATRRRMGDNSTWSRDVVAFGGSAALREFAFTGPRSNRWWYDLRQDRPGPFLNGVIARLQAAEEAPTEILWTQGQREARWLDRNPEQTGFTGRYIEGVRRILRAIRRGIAADDWRQIPAYIEIIGCGIEGDKPYFQAVRAAQRELLARYETQENIRPGAEAPLEVPLLDDIHPSSDGEAIMGWLTARAID